ncbi:putative MFS transporter Liz1/Seo1 [Tothia fuscella]|uniref:MFS transporter Liz1/Seo1 n=1 Tax=Tothia fuscella TaxID=1048955 RepID=A0A9P4NUL0_9PEZI|nr:putative MFS transporter Liz1/Seo1 [Tothia fuscella]
MAVSATSKDEKVSISGHEVVVQKEPRRRWVSYLWDSFDKSPEERWFLFKLDAALMTFASLGFFLKYLDQINIFSAFVSGMKEDLSLYGNQLNYMTSLWTVGYIIGQLPSNLILTRVRPRYWIPTMEVIWSVLTFLLSRATSAKHLYVLRFFIGLAESSFYPGITYILGSWYRKDELAKRSGIFFCSGILGASVSGYLAGGLYSLNGKGGYRGWQWLFIIDGCISLPIALAGYFFIPDVPEIAKPFYLTEAEVLLAQKRMKVEGRETRKPYTVAKIKRIVTSLRFWLIVFLYVCYSNSSIGVVPVFALFLKASKNPKYTVKQINNYPTITNAVALVTTLIWTWSSDTVFKGRRWPVIIIAGFINIFAAVILAVWKVSDRLKWMSFILAGSSAGLSAIILTWAQELTAGDNEERAIVVASANLLGAAVQAWLSLIIWQQVDAPRYHKGFVTLPFLTAAFMITALVLRQFYQNRNVKQ